jgi:methyl-accepting chemotaxis protein
MLLSLSVLSFLLVAVGAFTVYSINSIRRAQVELVEQQKLIKDIQKVGEYFSRMEQGIKGYLLTGSTAALKPFSDTEEVFHNYLVDLAKEFEQDQQQSARIVEMQAHLSKWVSASAVGEMMARRRLDAGLFNLSQFSEAIANGKGAQISANFSRVITEAIEAQKHRSTEALAKITSTSNSVVLWVTIGLIGFFLILVIVQSTVSGKVVGQIAGQLQAIEDVKTQVLHSREKLVRYVSDISCQSESVSQTIGGTSSATVEISSMLDVTKMNAEKSSELAKSSMQGGSSAQASSEGAVRAFSSIEDSVRALADRIESGVGELMKVQNTFLSISERTSVINEITFQTKLLSFNASVEAARAGEAGKGFAVVAEEVGNLAQVSDEAANEISSIIAKSKIEIEEIIDDFSKSVAELAKQSLEKTRQGNEIVYDSKSKIDQILNEAGETSQSVSNISEALAEQSTGVRNIAEDVQKIESSAKQTQTMVHELESETQCLKDCINRLEKTIIETKILLLGGQKAHSAPPSGNAAELKSKKTVISAA